MKQFLLLILILLVTFSCQSNDYETYRLSWVGWGLIVATGLGLLLVFVLKKGNVDETEEKLAAALKDSSTIDFEPIGDYVGGHPDIQSPVPGIVFRKNSNCCMFFYKNHSYDLPELKFKIKIKSFRNVSVADAPSSENRLLPDRNSLFDRAFTVLKKKRKNQVALLEIEWMDGESNRSAMFSFAGNDALQKANTARENLLRALN